MADEDLSWLFGIGQAAAANGIPPPSIPDNFDQRFQPAMGLPPVQGVPDLPTGPSMAFASGSPAGGLPTAPAATAINAAAPIVPQASSTNVPDIGQSLEPTQSVGPGVGGPLSLAPPNPGGQTPDLRKATTSGNALLDTLRGVAVPKPPEPQRVATPSLPRQAGTVQSGQLLALLNALEGPKAGAGLALGAGLRR